MHIEPITTETVCQAGRIYVQSWKHAYRGLVPQAYLDGLSENNGSFLQNPSGPAGFRQNLLLQDGGVYVATSTVGAARDPSM